MLGQMQHYWSGSFLAANAFIGLNLIGALLALLCMLSMSLLRRMEAMLPGRATLDVTIAALVRRCGRRRFPTSASAPSDRRKSPRRG